MVAKQLVESNVLVFKMGPAVKSTVGEFLYVVVKITEIKYGAFFYCHVFLLSLSLVSKLLEVSLPELIGH